MLSPPKFWILISEITGMPVEIQKCTFQPTIGRQNCRWQRAFLKSELKEVFDKINRIAERAKNFGPGFPPTYVDALWRLAREVEEILE